MHQPKTPHLLLMSALTILASAGILSACGGDETSTAPLTGGDNNATLPDAGADAENNGGSNNANNANNQGNNANNAGTDDAGDDTNTDDAANDTGGNNQGDDTGDTGSDTTDDVEEDTPPDTEEDPAVNPCDLFAVEPRTHFVPTLHAIEITTVGGSGADSLTFRYSDEGNQSGGLLDANTGYFLAGTIGGVSDSVTVEDTGCGLIDAAIIQVIDPLVIEPNKPQVNPGQQLCFVVSGGSDALSWELVQNGSGMGALVDQDGCYTSGVQRGEDVIFVRDERTGSVVELRVDITEDPLTITPHVPSLILPADEVYTINLVGGSGVYDFIVGPGSARVVPDPDEPTSAFQVTAENSDGEITVQVQDRYFEDVRTDVTVYTLARTVYEPVPYGTHSNEDTILDLGDINGDGLDDVAVGMRGNGIVGPSGGAVLIYTSDTTLGGLNPSPSQVLTGPVRSDFFGSSVARGDFDNDGCDDLAIGAWNRAGRGAVEIWVGCQGGALDLDAFRPDYLDNVTTDTLGAPTFALWRTYTGEAGGIRFGYGAATGDVNGDGFDDLLVSAPRADLSVAANPGRIYIYFGGELGLSEEADQIIDGKILDENFEATPTVNLELGWKLTTGNVNGDGCDDVLVGSPIHDSSHGLVSLYLSAPDDAGGCRLHGRSPAVTIQSAPEDRVRRAGNLGWRVALADFDGDCLDDIVASQVLVATIGRGNAAAGAVNVFRSDPSWHPDTPVKLVRTDADAIFTGDDWDQFGAGLSVGDFDSDGRNDLIASARYGEDTGTAPDIGEVKIFYGTVAGASCTPPGTIDALFTEPLLVTNQVDRWGDLFGNTLGMVGDLDGDDIDDLVVYNARGPAYRDLTNSLNHLGHMRWYKGGQDDYAFEDGVPLDAATVHGEDLNGYRTIRVGDLNADGFEDFAVSAPWWDRDEPRPTANVPYDVVHATAGAVYLFFGDADGVRPRPDAVLRDHPHHTGSDLFGYGMGPAGDIDGDGIDDLVVAAISEDSSATPCTSCRVNGATRSNTGALYVYLGRADIGGRFDGPYEELPRLSEPDFVICGPQINNTNIGREVIGGFDLDNDGRDDLIFSNPSWSASRGQVFYTSTATLTEANPLICLETSSSLLWEGVNNSDLVGHRLATMDVNGDGCDDMLASAYNYDPSITANAGSISVWLGMNGPGCPTELVRVQLNGAIANDNLGYGLAVADVNGDGTPDLLIGSSGYGPSNVGAVIIYDGLALQTLTAGLGADTEVTLNANDYLATVVDPGGASNNYALRVAALGDLNNDGFEDFAVGAQLAKLTADPDLRTGAAYLYYGSDDPSALAEYDALLHGEARMKSDPRWGIDITGGATHADATRGTLMIGSPYSEWAGEAFGQVGSVFVGHLPR